MHRNSNMESINNWISLLLYLSYNILYQKHKFYQCSLSIYCKTYSTDYNYCDSTLTFSINKTFSILLEQ